MGNLIERLVVHLHADLSISASTSYKATSSGLTLHIDKDLALTGHPGDAHDRINLAIPYWKFRAHV